MYYEDDTIAAISTPLGQGGIGIVRISGPQSCAIADRIFRPGKQGPLSSAKSFSMRHGFIFDPVQSAVVDEVLISVMRRPASYTREDVVEINCHGGMVPVRRILQLVISQGARLAQPGEFTRRAFLNGRLSLTQAEAVLDIIAAKSEEGLRIAAAHLTGELAKRLEASRERLIEISALIEAHIDFPEEEIGTEDSSAITGRLRTLCTDLEQLSATYNDARYFRDGVSVAIVGRPNVGKSSLLNALLKTDRAIVTDIPGTTRDLIEEYFSIEGLPIRIIDTAGIRASDELIEQEGIRRSIRAIESADLVIAIFDGSDSFQNEDADILTRMQGRSAIIIINKSDLQQKIDTGAIRVNGAPLVVISAKTGEGLAELRQTIFNSTVKHWDDERQGLVITSMRHKIALDQAEASLNRAINLIMQKQPLELVSIELRDSLDRIGELTGAVTTDDILERIFSAFCIGK